MAAITPAMVRAAQDHDHDHRHPSQPWVRVGRAQVRRLLEGALGTGSAVVGSGELAAFGLAMQEAQDAVAAATAENRALREHMGTLSEVESRARGDERERITSLFGEWVEVLLAEPGAHPPQAWRAAFAELVGADGNGSPAEPVLLQAAHLVAKHRDHAASVSVRLGRVRELAESWTKRAPAERTVTQDFASSPRDMVSADCGRQVLALLAEVPTDGPEPAAGEPGGTGESNGLPEAPVVAHGTGSER